MNPIEYVCARMECFLEGNFEKPKDSDELFNTLVYIWNYLMSDESYRRSLVESMIKRVGDLFSAQGSYTQY